ncbi:MAG: hypothetical protein ACKVU0_21085 [Saprospiraceae bacterium]
MLEHKDYAELTLEELLTEEKNLKKRETISRVLIGVAIGILVYGIVKKGFGFLHIFLPSGLIYIFYKDSEKNKEKISQVRTEINARNTK